MDDLQTIHEKMNNGHIKTSDIYDVYLMNRTTRDFKVKLKALVFLNHISFGFFKKGLNKKVDMLVEEYTLKINSCIKQ